MKILRSTALLACGICAAALPLNTLAQQREAWTTSRVHGSPEPPLPYVVERAFPDLTLARPLDLAPIPGSDRLIVVEEGGRISSFLPKPDVSQVELMADMRAFDPKISRTYAVAFHPGFLKNRLIFVRVSLDGRGERNLENGARILRFRMTDEAVPKLDLASGVVVFQWLSGGHEGGNMRFGPDGMLYITAGDADNPDPPDSFVTGQDIGDVLSSILRIDVDRSEAGHPYGVPKDNPFVGVPKARGEVWAYGLRNPWRLSFDEKTGDLFVGEVGWELWESIVRVEKGGNYGWSITEAGKQEVRPDRVLGPTPILKPLVTHPHEEAASVTGGEFYRGKRLPELSGMYIYGDWQMGTLWGLRHQGDTVKEHQVLCRTSLMPAAFGFSNDGELIVLDHSGGGMWRLQKNPRAGKPDEFPRRLSETGLFKQTSLQQPAAGVVQYEINAPRWADHAHAQRWVGFPNLAGVKIAQFSKGVVFGGQWQLPEGAVFAKTYSLEMERGNPATARKIETQILHFDGSLCGTYTYRWNEEQNDATLVAAQGEEAEFRVKDSHSPEGFTQQKWRFFSRSECGRCHTMWTGFTPGFNKLQLDRPTQSAGGRQIDVLSRIGLVPDEPSLADPHGTRGSLELRARSYLHTNCSSCHRFNGGGVVPSMMNIELALKEAKLVDAKPVQGDLGLPDGRIIAKGDPARSVLLYRMTTAGRGHMPYVGAELVDDRGVLLIRDWIASMKPNERDVPEKIGSQRRREIEALKRAAAGDESAIRSLLESNSGALSLALAIIDGSVKGEARRLSIKQGAVHPEALRRDLFERFLPSGERRKVLGPQINAEALLARKGDPARGSQVFAGVCAACHKLNGSGIDFGPDLHQVGSKWKRPDLLEQILYPAKVVDPQWQMATVELKSGEVKSGFILERNDRELRLKMAGGMDLKLPASDVKSATQSRTSVMPEGLLQNLTAQEAVDLLDYLSGLK
jgi:putative heme-binding domain-containing protein